MISFIKNCLTAEKRIIANLEDCKRIIHSIKETLEEGRDNLTKL